MIPYVKPKNKIKAMEIELAITKFFGDILKPIVTSAVKDAIHQEPEPPSDEYIKVKEACKLLKCSEPTFYAHVHQGTIKLKKNGHSSLVNKRKLLEDLESGKLTLRKDKHRR